MGIFFAFIAACFAGLNNYLIRRNISAGGSSQHYFLVLLLLSLFMVFLLNPVLMNNYTLDPVVIFVGLIIGLVLGGFYWALGKSFEAGPAGLSVAIINTSSVVPGLMMALVFGSLFGHPYTVWNGLGSLIVVIGFFVLGRSKIQAPNLQRWIMLVSVAFLLHVLYMVQLQWWDMVLDPSLPRSFLLPISADITKCSWFAPFMFLGAALLHWGIYGFNSQSQPLLRCEKLYGALGGLTNGTCMYFLILATQYSADWENPVIFPIFSVTIILISNLWARILYKENVNWLAIGICTLGIYVATAFENEEIVKNIVENIAE